MQVEKEGSRQVTKLEEILAEAKRRQFSKVRFAISYVISQHLHWR